jgi:hypothetical protein
VAVVEGEAMVVVETIQKSRALVTGLNMSVLLGRSITTTALRKYLVSICGRKTKNLTLHAKNTYN